MLTENCGVAPRGEQALEGRVHQHLEAAPVKGGRVGQAPQARLHGLGQLHFVREHVTDQLMWRARGAAEAREELRISDTREENKG